MRKGEKRNSKIEIRKPASSDSSSYRVSNFDFRVSLFARRNFQ